MKKLYFSLLTFLFLVVAHAQIVNIPDANFKAKLLSASPDNQIASTETPFYDATTDTWLVSNYNKIDTNNDGEIDLSEALAIKYLDNSGTQYLYGTIVNLIGVDSFVNLIVLKCGYNNITTLNVNNLTNLIKLVCNNNQLLTIDVSGLDNLNYLDCSYNQLSSLNVAGLTNLQSLNCNSNVITSLNVIGLNNLINLNCSGNQLPNIDINELDNLQILSCNFNPLLNLDVSSLTNLQQLSCWNSQLTSLNVSGLNNLQQLYCDRNQLASLTLNGATNLQNLSCSYNVLPSLNVTGLINLQTLNCSNNQLTNLNLSEVINLQILYCFSNQLTSLNASGLINLSLLNCTQNLITNLIVSGLYNLESLMCSFNQLPSLNLNSLNNLSFLDTSTNQLTSLNVSGLIYIQDLYCNNNQLTSINLTSLNNIQTLWCQNNQLTTLLMKNGSNETNLSFLGNPNLNYICADEVQIENVQSKITQYGYTNCHVNSYCSFSPGSNFYTIQGNNNLGLNNNGCDASDSVYPNLKFNITNGTISGSLISNNLGNYSIPVAAGTHTITPQFENPSYFTVSPADAVISFPTQTSPFVQNFCIAPNGVHHDLEVVVIPLEPARPGFDATYKIKYKNKGNLNETATVNFNYNEAILDFISSSYASTVQSAGLLSWALGTIAPFQTGEIIVTLNVNSPMETPAVNADDILNYSANIVGLTTDETPDDNAIGLNQIVVNSFDPNDKTCLEGATINPSMIGKYVHYKIRFENTGTFPAQNIVVKDLIDTTKFDLSTLQMTDASHNCFTRIDNSNKVEFIFENINLPFDDANNDGYVVFKIKTKPTLTVNSTISNSANIYFDYNFPIVTNTATSTFQVLKKDTFAFDNYFSIYPNPVKNELNLSTKQATTIYSLSIYNTLGQQVQTTTNPKKTIDVSGLKTGNYIVKVTTDKGVSSSKFIKE